jgi:hypothetical protein
MYSFFFKNSLRMCFMKQALEFKETHLDNCCFFSGHLQHQGKRTRLKRLAAHFGRPGNVLVTSY